MRFLIYLLLVFAASAEAQNPVELLVLRGDWAAVARAESASSASIEDRLLYAHAALATNEVNEAFCAFASVSTPADLRAWEGWTSQLVSAEPQSAAAHYLHGDALARLQQSDAAVAEFASSLRYDPHYYLARNARGVIYMIAGRYDEALMDFARVSATYPQFVDAPINSGYLYVLRNGSATAQLNSFKSALQVRPDAVLAMIGAGRAISAMGRLVTGVDVVDQTQPTCQALRAVAISDRRILFEWVKSQEQLEVAGKTDDAGTTLDSALRDIDIKRNPEAVMRAIDVANHSSDPRGNDKLLFTLRSIMNSSDTTLKSAVSQGLHLEEHSLLNTRADLIGSPDSFEMKSLVGSGIHFDLGTKKAGINTGLQNDTSLTEKVDMTKLKSNALATNQQNLEKLRDLASHLPSTGGAETFQLGESRIEKDNVPRIYHNTLCYSGTSRPHEEER